MHFAPNLGWRDVPLGRLVAERLGSEPARARSPTRPTSAPLAEHTWGAGVGVDHLIYLSSDVGVGGGLVIDGRPLVGAAGCAGEVGHVQVNPMGVRCRCGAIGCWETEIGGPALLRRAGSAEKGYRPEAVARLLREAAWGDPVALPAVEEVGRWLGRGPGGLVNAFNPQRVVLGGYLGSMWPLVEEIVQAELRVRVMAPALEAVEIRPAQLGAEAHAAGRRGAGAERGCWTSRPWSRCEGRSAVGVSRCRAGIGRSAGPGRRLGRAGAPELIERSAG